MNEHYTYELLSGVFFRCMHCYLSNSKLGSDYMDKVLKACVSGKYGTGSVHQPQIAPGELKKSNLALKQLKYFYTNQETKGFFQF